MSDQAVAITIFLFNLPLETQRVYQVLLLIPLGAFMLVILRNVVGIKTFLLCQS